LCPLAREPHANPSANHCILTPEGLALRQVRRRYWLTGQQRRRPLRVAGGAHRDQPWRRSLRAMICGSFSDNNLHGPWLVHGHDCVSSTENFLDTHRGSKWPPPTP
jgi:hypothetical protein